MKRNLFVSGLLITLSNVASAQQGPVEGLETVLNWINRSIGVLSRFISEFLFNLESYDKFLFAKLLLLILTLFIVYSVLQKNNILGRNKRINLIVAAAVSIIAIRFLPDDIVSGILLPYGALAVGITVFLPFLIFFFFIHQSGAGSFGRRAGWLLFGAAFIGIWISRVSEIGTANWIYIIGIISVIITALFDKTIHRYFEISREKKIKKSKYANYIAQINRKLRELEESKAAGDYEGLEKEFEKEYKRLLDLKKEYKKKYASY